MNIKKTLKRAIQRFGYRLERIDTSHEFRIMYRRTVEAVLYEQLRRAGDDFYFVQIGANDGISFDSLHKFVTRHKLRGLVVEPVRDYFEELRKNYSVQPQVTAVNVAIHRTARELDMYRVAANASGLPPWVKGIASFDSEHHRKSHTTCDVIVRERVRCVTLRELFDQQHITRIDYLQIDTEGYDYEILRMIDFDSLKPGVIKFEHMTQSGHMSLEQFAECAALLTKHGYCLLMDTTDAVSHLPFHVNGTTSTPV